MSLLGQVWTSNSGHSIRSTHNTLSDPDISLREPFDRSTANRFVPGCSRLHPSKPPKHTPPTPHPPPRKMPTLHRTLKSTLTSLTLTPLANPSHPSAANAHAPLPSPITTLLLHTWDTHDFGTSADALAAWLNARWAKSGYAVSRETVCFTLRLHGRDARLGGRDPGEGCFVRGRRGGVRMGGVLW